MKARIFTLLFILAAVAELIGEASMNRWVIYASKPLLMILLILIYRSSLQGQLRAFHKLILTAFVFSWLGDFFLMFSGQDEVFFLLGLASFLITHLLYAFAFIKSVSRDGNKGWVRKNPIVILPVVVYGFALIYILYGNLAEMKVPVIIYAVAIMLMVITAMNRYGGVSKGSFWMVLAGAVMFMISDSIIAFNKFYHPFELARIMIMLTYIVGQYYIAIGCLQKGADQYEGVPIP